MMPPGGSADCPRTLAVFSRALRNGLEISHEAVREASRAGDADWPRPLLQVDPPEFEYLSAAAELQAIVAAHIFDAVRWSNDRHQEP